MIIKNDSKKPLSTPHPRIHLEQKGKNVSTESSPSAASPTLFPPPYRLRLSSKVKGPTRPPTPVPGVSTVPGALDDGNGVAVVGLGVPPAE